MEWGQLVAAANDGDGPAVDHLIDARLKNELPPSEEQIFAESCFCYWTRDGPYTKDSRTGAAAHDPGELSSARDANATRMDFRFIEASHMSRLLGIGFEGSWDVSVTFHPHSTTTVRIHMVEEQREKGEKGTDLYSTVRSWVRSGYKLVREWKRSRVSSMRQNFSAYRKGFVARKVVYSVRCVSAQTLSDKHSPKGAIQSVASGLTMRMALSESPSMPESSGGSGRDGAGNVLQVSTCAVCTVGTSNSGDSFAHRVQLDLYGGSCCNLADWGSDANDSIDAQHGASTLRCIRSEVLNSSADVSEMQVNTAWLLSAKGIHTFRASVHHDMELTDAKKVKGFGRVTRFFKDRQNSAPTSTSLAVSNTLSMYVTCDLEFADFLNKLGVMRRVRDGSLCSNQSIQRLGSVGASARF
jgi:hypothetical protein